MFIKKIVTKFILPSILFFSLFGDVDDVTGQVINTESFDSTTFPPNGWTVSGGAGSLWVRRTTGVNPACTTHSGAAMARFTAFMQPNGIQEVMTTPVINYSGAAGSTPTFSLWIYRDNSSTAGDSLTILVNTVNSLTGAVRIGAVARSRFFVLPVNELTNGWYNYTFDVPLSFNTDTNYILLNGTGHQGGNIFIDDLQWTEYPVACSGTPTAGAVVANDTLICGGSGSTTLSLTGSGLTAGGLTFQWQSGPGNTGPWTDFGNSANSVNTGTISASTWYRCYVNCSVSGISDTSSATLVTINPNPAPVVTINLGSTVGYCAGATPLVLVASGANTYTWTPNIAINSVGDTAIASPLVTTSYNVIGMDTTGCSGSANITVNVTNPPFAVATVDLDTICSGQSVFLHAFVQGPGFGIQYQWQPGSLNGANQTVSPPVTTMYTVSAFSTITGCTGYDSVEIYVYPTPIAGFTYTINNLTYTFTDTSSGGVTSWLWDFGDGNTDTIQNPVHTYGGNGTYTITLTVSNGNCTNTFTITITVVSVDEITFSNGSVLLVYPNPVSDITTVEFTYDESPVQLAVIDPLGQFVLNQIVYPYDENKYKSNLDLSSLSAGIYVLQIGTQSEIKFLQFIKQ